MNFDGVIDLADSPLFEEAEELPPGAVANPPLTFAAISIGYAGAVRDDASELWLARHRWYAPDLGRWISRDPAGYIDGLNLYQYVSNNPNKYFDPFGLFQHDPGWVRQWESQQLQRDLGMTAREVQDLRASATTSALAGQAAVASALVPGPEDLAIGAVLGSKIAQGAIRGATNLARKIFRGADNAKDAARAADNAADATRAAKAQRLQRNGDIGKQGELQAGIDPSKPKTPIKVNGGRRVPDDLDRAAGTLTEVKNVQRLSNTEQLRDFAQYARENKFDFILKIRENTKLSGPLQKLVDKGEVFLERCLRGPK